MSSWTRFRDRAVRQLLGWLGIDFSDLAVSEPSRPSEPSEPSGPSEPSAPPAWDAATLASCWGGTNASKRIMNCLSPKMAEATFKEYVKWTKVQGANTIHLILVNKGDGEYSGYSPWGTGKGPSGGEPDLTTVRLMNERMDYCREQGLAVVVWLTTDDGKDWAAALAKNADAALRWIADDGLLGDASTVVLGLEMDEYWDSSQAKAVAAATRKVWNGKIGTHHTGGKATFVSLGDILFYQVDPGRSAAQIKSDTAAALKHGKPVNFFELDRGPNKTLAQAALDGGAFGVGNCAPGVTAKGTTGTKATEETPAKAAEVEFRFGGVKANPQEDTRCRLSGLKIGGDTLSFKWETGIPGDWKRGETEKGPMILACAFYDQGGKWVGGKFDWIDEKRSTRPLKNILGGYNGWNAAAWNAAKRRAFCVMSADGKYRSNLIEA